MIKLYFYIVTEKKRYKTKTNRFLYSTKYKIEKKGTTLYEKNWYLLMM